MPRSAAPVCRRRAAASRPPARLLAGARVDRCRARGAPRAERSASTPSAAAAVSPRASAFRSPAKGSAAAIASTSAASVDQAAGGADRSPINQKSMPRSCASGASDRMSATTAPQPAATTTPVSRSRVGDQGPLPRARPKTIAVDAIAPPNAPTGTSHAAAPSSMVVSAPAAAPPDTPNTYGSAREFLRSTWSSAPASERHPPAANAATARGKRSSRTIACCVESPEAKSARRTDAGSIATLPAESASAIATSAMAVSASRAGTAEIRDIATKSVGGRAGKSGDYMPGAGAPGAKRSPRLLWRWPIISHSMVPRHLGRRIGRS